MKFRGADQDKLFVVLDEDGDVVGADTVGPHEIIKAHNAVDTLFFGTLNEAARFIADRFPTEREHGWRVAQVGLKGYTANSFDIQVGNIWFERNK